MIKKCTIDDIHEITELAFKKNNLPESNSAYCSNKYDSIKSDFINLIESEQHNVIGYYTGEALIGVIGVFVNAVNKMVDIVGPFIENDDLNSIAVKLLDNAKEYYSKNFRTNFYFDSRNKDYLCFMKEINAESDGNEYNLSIRRNEFIIADSDYNVGKISDNNYDSLIELHDKIFPDMYVSGHELISSLNGNRDIYVITDGNSLKAYGVFKSFSKSDKESCIEILGVDSNNRNRGMGRAVLGEMLNNAFQNSDMEKVFLIVDDINVNALGLYRSVGFKVDVENCAYRLK